MIRELVFVASSANRTCGFPASGFRTAFTTRHSHGPAEGLERDHSKLAKDVMLREASMSTRLHLMPPTKKAAHPLIHKAIQIRTDSPHAPIPEVRRPAPQFV